MPITLTDEQMKVIDETLRDMADAWWHYINDEDAELPGEIPDGIVDMRITLGLPEYEPEEDDDDGQ